MSLQAQARAYVNNNSASLTSFSSRNQSYSVGGTWTAGGRLIDAGYVKAHTATVGGIAFFANRQFVTGELSIYRSNLHTFWMNVQTPLTRRIALLAGMSAVRDTGDGRQDAQGRGIGSAIPAFQAAQTFPLRYLSPQGRLSVTIHRQVQWNFGYQYYGYAERFFDPRDYRAHTGYTSLLWSF